jgi:hypothetical protein
MPTTFPPKPALLRAARLDDLVAEIVRRSRTPHSRAAIVETLPAAIAGLLLTSSALLRRAG